MNEVFRVSLQVLHPHRDAHSVLMVQLFGVDMFYRPTSKHDQPGLIKARDGPLDELGEHALLGWAVLPLFKQYVVLLVAICDKCSDCRKTNLSNIIMSHYQSIYDE